MNLVSVVLQFFFDHQARVQAEKLREAGLRAAEKGRRMAIAGAFLALSAAFIFSSLLLFLVDLGLQIDRGAGIGYSGLMISASILLALGLLCILAGGLTARERAPVAPPAPAAPSARDELRELLEELAVTFLKDFKESQRKARATPPEA